MPLESTGPDILIQDLEEIPQDTRPLLMQHAPRKCRRCGETCGAEETYCEECLALIHAFPIRRIAVVGALLCALVSLASVFFLGCNLLIARQAVRGDEARAESSWHAASDGYTAANNVALRLNMLLFPGSDKTYFTVGSRTIVKRIQVEREVNGVVNAGKIANECFGDSPPAALRGMMREFAAVGAFVQKMGVLTERYSDSLDGKAGKYEDMLMLVESALEELPNTPDYMVAYYKFEASYSLADDYARTAALLTKLERIAPRELWLYASEGIRAYDLAGEYEKGLAICSRLMTLDPSNPATIAYTISQLRLLNIWDKALEVYEEGLRLTQTTSEMERQRAIILMLQGDLPTALDALVSSYSPRTASLEHVATICVCAFAAGDQTVYDEYKAILDGYARFEQVDLFAAGECTLESIFMTGGGEIR